RAAGRGGGGRGAGRGATAGGGRGGRAGGFWARGRPREGPRRPGRGGGGPRRGSLRAADAARRAGMSRHSRLDPRIRAGPERTDLDPSPRSSRRRTGSGGRVTENCVERQVGRATATREWLGEAAARRAGRRARRLGEVLRAQRPAPGARCRGRSPAHVLQRARNPVAEIAGRPSAERDGVSRPSAYPPPKPESDAFSCTTLSP